MQQRGKRLGVAAFRLRTDGYSIYCSRRDQLRVASTLRLSLES
jgi:hypothetical protein